MKREQSLAVIRPAKHDVLVLDFDGVLTDLYVDDRMAKDEGGIEQNQEILDFWIHANQKEYKKFDRFFQRLEMLAVKTSEPSPEAVSLLKRFKGKAYIASMQPRKPILYFLRRHGLTNRFHEILTRDDFKSKEAELTYLIEKEEKLRLLFIDDMEVNVLVARRLGVRAVLLKRSFPSYTVLEDEIERICLKFYGGLDFAHNTQHIHRTVRLAMLIGRKEGADQRIVKLGAMVHQFHDNIPMLERGLKPLCTPWMAGRLIECASYRPFKTPRKASPEAKVVFDADALQVLGPNGVLREIACNLVARKKPFVRSVEDARATEQKFLKSLQTDTAKRLARPGVAASEHFWRVYDALESSLAQKKTTVQ